MRGRHIDQIMMCTVYGVCRVNSKELTFKKILDKYRQQSQTTSRVYRDVKLKGMVVVVCSATWYSFACFFVCLLVLCVLFLLDK